MSSDKHLWALAAPVGLVPTHPTLLWPHSVRYNPISSSVARSGRERKRHSSKYVDLYEEELQALTLMADTASHRLDLCVGGKYRLGKKIGPGSFGTLYIFLL